MPIFMQKWAPKTDYVKKKVSEGIFKMIGKQFKKILKKQFNNPVCSYE